MSKAILFDLDGTLLNIDMDVFLTYYFQSMMRFAGERGYAHPKRLMEQVYRSTDVMIANRDPKITNEQAFMEDFLAACSYPAAEARQFFDEFYQEVFPKLHLHTKPFPIVPHLMNSIFQQGYKVVIATNPVFPLSAVQQRINWAGLGGFPFDLITSYENMHFTKPHPEYFEEISEIIGVAPTDCLMVGNDVDEDLPAGKTGMQTYLMEDLLIDKGQSSLFPDRRGSLEDFMSFINGQPS